MLFRVASTAGNEEQDDRYEEAELSHSKSLLWESSQKRSQGPLPRSQRQVDRVAGVGGLVGGLDDLDGVAALGGGDRRVGVGLDGGEG